MTAIRRDPESSFDQCGNAVSTHDSGYSWTTDHESFIFQATHDSRTAVCFSGLLVNRLNSLKQSLVFSSPTAWNSMEPTEVTAWTDFQCLADLGDREILLVFPDKPIFQVLSLEKKSRLFLKCPVPFLCLPVLCEAGGVLLLVLSVSRCRGKHAGCRHDAL